MTQAKLPLKTERKQSRYKLTFAEGVGLSSDSDQVTLKFMSGSEWGQESKYVKIDRKLAEELSRLLNYELDVTDWAR